MQVDLAELTRYLSERAGTPAHIEVVRQLGGEVSGEAALKQFGYGRPFLVSYRVGGQEEKLVFHHIRRNAFGRERADDRVAAVWLDFHTFNRLPCHVPAVDMVMRTREGQIRSIESAQELLLVTAFRPGHPYADDLGRIREAGEVHPLDIQRADRLASCLAEIHEVKHDDPTLWRRRLRDLIGHGEGIMGLTDSYPRDVPSVNESELRAIEEEANRWRWRLKPMNHRLSRVHGDFHPFNVVFEQGDQLHLLDRSRGEWGEPADDVSCMSINYIFFSLQRSGNLEGAFRELHDRFWDRYLQLRPDKELLQVIQPWFAWRALVLASPLWYPTISEDVRSKMLFFARQVMSIESYDYRRVNDYIENG
jgi:aminoglycoside phosphotransferase (APT) family kinase protein